MKYEVKTNYNKILGFHKIMVGYSSNVYNKTGV